MGKTWTLIEIIELKRLHLKGWTDDQIAKKLGRNKNSVQLKRNRVLGSFISCKDCGKQVKNKGGKRLRCIPCANKRTEKRKKERYKKWIIENKEALKEKRDKIRFGGMREQAIQRDNETCQMCGINRSEHYLKFNCDITVDHIDGNGRNSDKQNNNINNLMTLCLSCHGKKDTRRRVRDWSMCAENLRLYWENQRELKKQSVIELLQKGLRPVKSSNGVIHWK